MEILEGNKLIATFMNYGGGENDIYKNPPAEFHKSWDRLMPVVGKIKKMQHNPNEMFMGTTFERKAEFDMLLSLPIYISIEMLWKFVIHFIEWYNEQPKPKNSINTPK